MELMSKFADRIQAFLDFRKSRGFKENPYSQQLSYFDQWCVKKFPEEGMLSKELVFQWVNDATSNLSDGQNKIYCIRQFANYLCATGEEAYILPGKYKSQKKGTTPYIFSDEELVALFQAIDNLPPTTAEPFLHIILPVLFRLTYTCGLRPNESRELLTKNVNLKTGEILIAHTKKNKERYVVMSDDMLAIARRYDKRRRMFGQENPYFFPSASGECLSSHTVYAAFNRAWSNAVFQEDTPRKTRVRVYDLRHRFASACLCRWIEQRENLFAMLPYLSQYMGHNSLTETAYYIHILPENLLRTTSINWAIFDEMFQEVKNNDSF